MSDSGIDDDTTDPAGPPRPVALVTGGSRGIGAFTCRALAEAGVNVVLLYRNKARKADAVAAAVRSLGVSCTTYACDLADDAQLARVTGAIKDRLDRLDFVVLNAAGGFEAGKPDDYPWRMNVHAQVALVRALAPLLDEGSRAVYITSYLAHTYAGADLGPYTPIAASKQEGERALADEFETSPAGFQVLNIGLVTDSINAKLFDRVYGGRLLESALYTGELLEADVGRRVAEHCLEPLEAPVVAIHGDLVSGDHSRTR